VQLDKIIYYIKLIVHSRAYENLYLPSIVVAMVIK